MNKAICLLAALFLTAVTAFADQLRVIKDNDEAIQIRFDLVTQAARGNNKEILFEYFEVGKDDFTLNLLAYLKHVAMHDNVKVKILVDGMFNDLSSKTMAALINGTKGNLEIRIFNQVNPLTLLSSSRRSHDKMFISEGNTLVVGSRNAAGAYYGQSLDDSKNYKDLDVVVRGKAAATARNYFMALWNGNEVDDVFLGKFSARQLSGNCSNRERGEYSCEQQKQMLATSLAKQNKIINKRIQGLRNLVFLNRDIGWEADLMNVGPIQFLANETDFKVGRSHHRISDQIFTRLGKARADITIVTPYLFPSKEVLTFLGKVIQNGVHITILTNSRASSDSMLAQAGYEEIKDKLIRMGVKLYEYKGPGILHAKTMLIDGKTAIVGSYNLDRRSMYLNREVAVSINDSGNVMNSLKSSVRQFMKKSWLVGSGGQEVDAGADYRKANSSKAGDIFAAVLKLNFPFVRDQI